MNSLDLGKSSCMAKLSLFVCHEAGTFYRLRLGKEGEGKKFKKISKVFLGVNLLKKMECAVVFHNVGYPIKI